MSTSVAERLLDATIECLTLHGYAATTTRKVAELAGVSQGAQQHYYPTKAALVEAALGRLMEQLIAEGTARSVSATDEHARAEALLDLILEMHQLPIAPAVIELLVAARTDAALAPCAAAMVTIAHEAMLSLARESLPTYAANPGFEDSLRIAVASARGTAILAVLPGAEAAHPSWPALRTHLVAALCQDA